MQLRPHRCVRGWWSSADFVDDPHQLSTLFAMSSRFVVTDSSLCSVFMWRLSASSCLLSMFCCASSLWCVLLPKSMRN